MNPDKLILSVVELELVLLGHELVNLGEEMGTLYEVILGTHSLQVRGKPEGLLLELPDALHPRRNRGQLHFGVRLQCNYTERWKCVDNFMLFV